VLNADPLFYRYSYSSLGDSIAPPPPPPPPRSRNIDVIGLPPLTQLSIICSVGETISSTDIATLSIER